MENIPKINIMCETRDGLVTGTTNLNVIRVETEDDNSFTAVTDYRPRDDRLEEALALIEECREELELAKVEFDQMVEGLLLTKIFEGDEALPHNGDISKQHVTKLRDKLADIIKKLPEKK